MPVYTTEERVQFIYLYIENGRNLMRACEAFHAQFPLRPKPSRPGLQKIVRRFEATGSVGRKKYSSRARPVTGEENTINVLASVAAVPVMSISERAAEAGISCSSVQRILAKNKFHGYKVHRAQELHGDDFFNREFFCQWFVEKERANPDFVSCILTSDEATFHLSGKINSQNTRYWADQNPHWLRPDRRQTDPRVNVWCGIYRNRIIGPYFLDAPLTGIGYLQHLEDVLNPFLDELPLVQLRRIYFQQDGAPVHFAEVVRAYLDYLLPGKWIGRGGPVAWPARSPDLTPPDFFLWGHLKSVVYNNNPRTIDDLKENIFNACAAITPDTIGNVLREWSARIAQCLMARGHHFEHLT